MLDEKRRAVAASLFKIGAIKFGEFRLKLHETQPNAPLSPIYVDLRLLRSFPAAMDEVVALYVELCRNLTFDLYADVPTAATPIVAVLSHVTRVPMISPRADTKGHGGRQSVDGAFASGNIALLIDDLITRAQSKLEAIEVLEKNGLKVRDIVVLVDREQGGVQELGTRGYNCHCSFRLPELLRHYLDSGQMDVRQFDRVMEYLATAVH